MQNDIISYIIDTRLYLNITNRCTLVCQFCPKTQHCHEVKGYDLTLHHRPELKEIIEAIGDPARYDEVVFCGFGEPTLRLKVLFKVARYIKDNGGKVRLNTDGLINLVHKRNVLPEMQGLIDSISISMNAQNEDVYTRHCCPQLPGSYAAMLEFLKLAPDYIPHVTATAINGLEGVDVAACASKADQLGVRFKERQLDVVG